MKPRKRRIYGTEERNLKMFGDYVYNGLTIYEIGKKYGVPPQRISNLVTSELSETFKKLHKDNRYERLQKAFKLNDL